MKIKGKIIPGYGVASGKGQDPRYPKGTLRLQYPFFKERGLDLGDYFLGTLNIDISPFSYERGKPNYFFEAIGSDSICSRLFEGLLIWGRDEPLQTFLIPLYDYIVGLRSTRGWQKPGPT